MESNKMNITQPETGQTPVLSPVQWAVNIFISCIPVLGLGMLFLWGFKATGVNETKKNWARGMLIVIALGVAAVILFYAILAIAGFAVQQF